MDAELMLSNIIPLSSLFNVNISTHIQFLVEFHEFCAHKFSLVEALNSTQQPLAA